MTLARPAPGTIDETTTAPESTRGGRARLVVGLATLATFVLGVIGLGTDSFWVDDGFTLTHARLGTGEFFRVIGDQEMNGSLYTTFMHLWAGLGTSEAWVRFPSVVFATAAVPVLFVLGRRLFDERVAVVACVLYACNAYVVEFAHEGRTYAFTLLLATASMTLLVRYVDAPSRPRWWAWVLVSGALPLAHFFGLLVVGAEAAALLTRRRLPTPRRGLLAGFAGIALLASPIAVFLALGGDKGQVSTAPSLTPVRFVGVFSRLVGNGGPALLLVAGVAIAVALVHHGRRLVADRGVADERSWGFVLTVAWVAVPILTMAVVSVVKPLFGARYFLLITPGLILLMAAGVVALRRRWLAVGLLTVLVVGSLVSTAFWYPRAPHDDFRALTHDLLAEAQPGDGVLFVPWFTRTTFEVYADRDPAARDVLVPLDPDPDWDQWLLTDRPPDVTPARADALLADHDRIWLVERNGTDETPQSGDLVVFTEALERNGFEAVDQTSYSGLDLVLYERA